MRSRLLETGGNAVLCYKVANNLAELCSSSSWPVELTSHEIAYLAEDVSKQNVEGTVWAF